MRSLGIGTPSFRRFLRSIAATLGFLLGVFPACCPRLVCSSAAGLFGLRRHCSPPITRLSRPWNFNKKLLTFPDFRHKKLHFGMEQLYLSNCLDIMPSLEPHSIDAIIADLPYGVTRCKWDSEIPLDRLWTSYKRLLAPRGIIVLFAAQPFTSTLIASNPSMFKYCWYWKKEKGTGFLNAKHQPLRAVEEVCVFYKKKKTYNPQMIPLDKPYKHTLPLSKTDTTNSVRTFEGDPDNRERVLYTEKYPTNVLSFQRDKSNRGLIPTQKPVALMEYLVKTYTNPGDTVLDNVMGSGTTGVACKTLGRDFIGIELNPEHFKIAKERIDTS